MQTLLTLDSQDYTDEMPVVEKHTVRAVILHEGRMAMQCSGRGDFKMPGGGVEDGESHAETLLREVREEMGMIVLPASIRPIGMIDELRQDVFCPGVKYVCHSYFYLCDISEERLEPQMTASEIAKGFRPVWEYPQEICRINDLILGDELWQKRDTEFIRMVVAGSIDLSDVRHPVHIV